LPAQWVATKEVSLADLQRFPGNARRGDVDEIRKSIRRHGQYRAIVVRDTGTELVILAGNHTRDALAAEGNETARCEIITCTDDEARRINLADNRLSDKAQDDDDALVELLSYLEDDYEGTGWTAEDVEKLITPPGPMDEGDAPTDDLPVTWGVIVECDSEDQQTRLLADLDGNGWRVRALMT
jgi:ParB-like chromosome segregation protein Spo0J